MNNYFYLRLSIFFITAMPCKMVMNFCFEVNLFIQKTAEQCLWLTKDRMEVQYRQSGQENVRTLLPT